MSPGLLIKRGPESVGSLHDPVVETPIDGRWNRLHQALEQMVMGVHETWCDHTVSSVNDPLVRPRDKITHLGDQGAVT